MAEWTQHSEFHVSDTLAIVYSLLTYLVVDISNDIAEVAVDVKHHLDNHMRHLCSLMTSQSNCWVLSGSLSAGWWWCWCCSYHTRRRAEWCQARRRAEWWPARRRTEWWPARRRTECCHTPRWGLALSKVIIPWMFWCLVQLTFLLCGDMVGVFLTSRSPYRHSDID